MRWQKLYSRAEIKSTLVRAGKEFKACKFLLLTHLGQVKGFSWQVLFTHPDSQLSFREAIALSSHRAEESHFLSSGTCSKVPISQCCTALLSLSQHLCWVQRNHQFPVFWGCWSELAELLAADLASIIPVSRSSRGKLQKQQQLTAWSCSQEHGMGGIQLTKTTSAVVVLALSQYRADELSTKRVSFSPLARKISVGD